MFTLFDLQSSTRGAKLNKLNIFVLLSDAENQ